MASKKKTSIKEITALADLTSDPRNANKGTTRGRKMVADSLTSYGAGRSILVDKHGTVIAGNKTLEGAPAAGIKDLILVKTDGTQLVAVQRTDLDLASDPKAKQLAIADNRAAEVGIEWDPAVLKMFPTEELQPFFTAVELRKLKVAEEAAQDGPDAQVDKAAALQKLWKTGRGQIWDIPSASVPGKSHRMMCGDSGSETDTLALFAGSKASLLATDPPYGVAFGVDSGPESARRFSAIAGDDADGPNLQRFLEGVFRTALLHLEDHAAWYLWHAQLTQGFFAAAAAAAQLLIHRQIIWAKSHFILGHGDYHWQHELCFYGWREGYRARWLGGRAQSTLWVIENPRKHEYHPTQKPPELFIRAMENNTKEGEICYEPFSGTGTQFVAAEQCKRVCYGLDIEPKYVAVGLQRMADMGLRPKLVYPVDGKIRVPVRGGDSKRRPAQSGRRRIAVPPGRGAQANPGVV